MEIPQSIFDRMVAQARREIPIESCGILAGHNGRIEKMYEMSNADNSSTHFTLKPHEQFAVVKDIRSAGLRMVGIYHSHPATPARLSEEDIRLAITPNVVYLVLSLMGEEPCLKCFNVASGDVIEVPIEIVPD
ncbi:MAG: M67 family metallopeptidase [Planctomycetota bacterium]